MSFMRGFFKAKEKVSTTIKKNKSNIVDTTVAGISLLFGIYHGSAGTESKLKPIPIPHSDKKFTPRK